MFTQPVHGAQFYGRHDVLNILNKRMDALRSGYRQNVALSGKMLTGKSSILHHFLTSVNDRTCIPVYVEVGEKSFISFAYKFMATVLYGFLKSEDIACQKDMDKLIEAGYRIIPKTTAQIDKIRTDLSKRRFNNAYRMLLELTSILREETMKSCIVILDEFHNLEKFSIKNPFYYLGKIIMVQKNTMYIVSSSERNAFRKILSEKLSLLFGNFEVINISGFDSQTAKHFVREKISPITVSEYYLDYLLDITEGNPFYLSMISEGIKSCANRISCNRVNVELLKSALAEVTFNPTGTINQHFKNQIHYILDKKTRAQHLNILYALCQGVNRLKDISIFLKSDERVISRKIDELISFDLVFKCGVFIRISDRLFEFWLKNVYHKKEMALIDTISDEVAEFMNFVESDIEGYLIEYNQGDMERLRSAFLSFKGELVEIDRRSRRLPRFSRIDILKYGSDKDYIACESEAKYWIFKVMRKYTDEHDVIDFLERAGAHKNSAIRRVIISLAGIDQNALLMAKERNIWVWNLKTINMLMRLYGMHNLIV